MSVPTGHLQLILIGKDAYSKGNILVLGQLPLGQLPLGQLPLGQLPRGQLPPRTPVGQLPQGQLPILVGQLPLRPYAILGPIVIFHIYITISPPVIRSQNMCTSRATAFATERKKERKKES